MIGLIKNSKLRRAGLVKMNNADTCRKLTSERDQEDLKQNGLTKLTRM